MQEIIRDLLDTIRSSAAALSDAALTLVAGFGTLEFVRYAMTSSDPFSGGFRPAEFIRIILTIIVTAFICTNLYGLALQLMEYFMQIIGKTGKIENIKTYVYDPVSLVFMATDDVLTPLARYIEDKSSGFMGGVKNLHLVIGYFIACLVVGGVFAIAALQLTLAVIELHLVAAFGTVLLPFQVCKWTESVGGSRVYMALAGQIIKVGMLCFMAGLATGFFKEHVIGNMASYDEIGLSYFAYLVVVSLLLGALISSAGGVANAIMTGSPAFDGRRAMTAGFGMAMSGMAGVKKMMPWIGKLAGKVGNSLSNKAWAGAAKNIQSTSKAAQLKAGGGAAGAGQAKGGLNRAFKERLENRKNEK
jgi:hypothetical protein